MFSSYVTIEYDREKYCDSYYNSELIIYLSLMLHVRVICLWISE